MITLLPFAVWLASLLPFIQRICMNNEILCGVMRSHHSHNNHKVLHIRSYGNHGLVILCSYSLLVYSHYSESIRSGVVIGKSLLLIMSRDLACHVLFDRARVIVLNDFVMMLRVIVQFL